MRSQTRLVTFVIVVTFGLLLYLPLLSTNYDLNGMAEAQARDTGRRRDAADEAFLGPLVTKAREALGTATFVAVESAGRAVTYDDAIAEARSWLLKRF